MADGEAPKRAPAGPRLSITIDAPLRRAMRIAAARHDMEVNDWARTILVTAANKAVKKIYGEEGP